MLLQSWLRTKMLRGHDADAKKISLGPALKLCAVTDVSINVVSLNCSLHSRS